MAYSPSNASTFNQLTQQGLGVTDASTQSGVSTNPGAYGYGTNANLGAVIPGAGGVTDAAGLTKVNYSQNYSGQPSQQVQLAMNAAEINEFTNRNSGFGVQEVSPGNFVPTISVTAQAPDPNSPGGNGGTNTVQDPAQRAASEQVQATAAGAGATPFSQDPAQRAAAAQATAAAAVPAASPFSQDRAQQASAAQVAATSAGPGASPFSQDPAQRAEAARVAAAAAAVDSPTFIQAPGEAGRGTATAAAVDSPTFVQAPGEAGRGTAAPGAVSSTFVQAPGEAGRGTAPTATVPAPVVQSDAETARLARLNLAAAPNQSAAETARLARYNTAAAEQQASKLLTQRQKTLDNQQKIANQGDWRVRLSLAEDSNYLYNAPSKEEQGILAPLNATYGVIFPYTPKIDVSYKASYASESLTHSNYLSYFYKSSSVDLVKISCPFTAQDTTEAAYLLAVIHFFRSATKMFYGQDTQRGAPPPLVFLTGLGQYQFNNHPCVITSFEYNLPADVDYIRAGSPNINGTDLLVRRTSEKNNLPTGIASSVQARLNALFTSQGINKGANKTVSQGTALVPSFSKNAPTYVPTKIDISIGMLPIVTRSQASRQFSLKQFANGELVKQGFW